MGVHFYNPEDFVNSPDKLSPFRKNNRFYNLQDEKNHPVFWRSFLMILIGLLLGRRRKKMANFLQVPDIAAHSALRDNSSSNKSVITWLGQATFLISVPGITIITDPVLGDISLLYKRWAPPGILPQNLPTIDLIVLSHNHRDHLDKKTIKLLVEKNPHIKVLVPLGDKVWLNKWGFDNVQEYSWWQSTKIELNNQTVNLTFLPAHHWSQRGLFDRNRSLWGSWLIQSADTTIYFAGDTAYSTHFSAIAEQFPSIDIALLPIGPCEPYQWMHDAHLNADQALQAFKDLNARHFIPMHWGTFPFGIDYQALPYEYLLESWKAHCSEQDSKHLHAALGGQTLKF